MSSFASYNNHHNSFKKEAIFSIFNSINWEAFLWQHICKCLLPCQRTLAIITLE